MEEKNRIVVMFLFVLLLGYLSFLVLSPFLSFVIFGFLLAFMTYPLYAWFELRMRPSFAALAVILLTLLVIIIPSIFIFNDLVSQANGAYVFFSQHASAFDSTRAVESVNNWLGIDISDLFASMLGRVQSTVTSSIPGILSRAGSTLLGLFLMFLVMYYGLKEGKDWYARGSALMPVKRSQRKRLRDELSRMTRALFYGQVLTSALVGVACGVVFALFGVTSPVFWGFIIAVFAFLPFLGTPIVYVPAGLILILNNEWFAGIGVLVLCTAIVFFFDYVFRPRIVSRSARIHPLTVIIGAIGGAVMFGFIGFLLGPLVINLLLLLLRFEAVMDDKD